MSFNNIEHIEGFDALPLTHLNLRGNKIISLNGLQNLPNLIGLDISDNQVTELNFLRNLTTLMQLNAANNLIGSHITKELSDKSDQDIIDELLACLGSLNFLRQLNLSGNPLSVSLETYR